MVAAENNLKVWKQACLEEVKRTGDEWVAKVKVEGQGVKTVRAKVMIDATELGDVAKICGVKYDIGMESRDDTHEDIAPEKKNNIVQDITYVAILKDYGKDVTIPEPEGYDPKEFACAPARPHRAVVTTLARVSQAHGPCPPTDSSMGGAAPGLQPLPLAASSLSPGGPPACTPQPEGCSHKRALHL